jgi:hypothetical protein
VAADVARIVCRGDTTTVETPIVRAQADGVHLLVDSDDPDVSFSVRDDEGRTDRWGRTPGTDEPFAVLLAPGQIRVACGTSMNVMDGVAFEVTDPRGLWHDARLSCLASGDFDARGSFPFYADVNPLPEAIARAVSGVRATDAISYAGYPRSSGDPEPSSYRIVRAGQVVGSMDIVSYDVRTYAYALYSCDSSGIGMPGEPTAGQLATPFDMPGLSRCDPYLTDCSIVYLTATRYADIRDEDPDRYALPEMPEAACLASQPEGCPPNPDDVVLQILLDPADALRLIWEEGCGGSEETVCR